jgi:L-asparagine transporter-like permease
MSTPKCFGHLEIVVAVGKIALLIMMVVFAYITTEDTNYNHHTTVIRRHEDIGGPMSMSALLVVSDYVIATAKVFTNDNSTSTVWRGE